MISLDQMNPQQKKAVEYTEGPLLILAGAGSGKTRVLTTRTAYLIEEKGVNPYNILAITFTNKAAGEMRERIDKMVGFGAESIWVSTFHSCCVRILRRYIDRLGYGINFTIYDTEDQKNLMKDVCGRLQIDTKIYKEKTFLAEISSAKNELISPVEYSDQNAWDFGRRKIAEVYAEYQQALKANNALDFDDLLVKTVELFKACPDVLSSYQERFRYIMVDEYQDTNTVQFEFVRLLAQRYQNLCVVGDDDQSIYRFRGANIYNILNFEKQYPNAAVIKLEQNYRSTQNILDVANAVIANNTGRKDKHMWTDNGSGDLVAFRKVETGTDEARVIAADICRRVRSGECSYRDCAVLYRTNAQSRLFEERFIAENVPYKLIGGTNFYARKEIKDLLAYLKTIANGSDDVAVKRIINVPKRGIGATTIKKVDQFAYDENMSFFDALANAEYIPTLGKAGAKLKPFVALITAFRAKAAGCKVKELLEALIEETGYVMDLEAEGTDEAKSRIENIDELISKAASYDDSETEPSLTGFLEQVALVAEIDSLEEGSDYVVLMTLHSAKGLEFDNVYLAGMEDGLFPSYMSITSDDAQEEIEEERRLAYVGITRARKHLLLTAAGSRLLRGQPQFNAVSRFVKEIPTELLKNQSSSGSQAGYRGGMRSGSYGTYSGSSSRGFGSSASQTSRPSKPATFVPASGQKSFGSPQGSLDYGVGDRVFHIKFGEGTVQAVVDGGRDYEVTVDFDKAGTKKMFASFAKLRKL